MLVNYLLDYSIIWNAGDNLYRPKRAILFADTGLVTNRKDIINNKVLANAKTKLASQNSYKKVNFFNNV